MGGYLLCIASESGVPIFARKLGDIKPIEFPLAASLNGVRVFGQAQGVQLLTTLTQSTRSLWRDFHDKISLIFVGTDDTPSDIHIAHLLKNIYSALVLHVGHEFIAKTNNVDKLKKEFKLCYPMIDKLLQGLRPNEHTQYFGDLTRSTDVFLQVDPNIQNLIDTFAGSTTSTFVCLSSRGVTLAASKDWAGLHGQDALLLLFKAHEVDEPTAELTVYIQSGHKFRLLVFKFTETLRLTLLCGPDPPLNLVKKEVKKLETRAGEIFSKDEDLGHRLACSYKYFLLEKSIAGFLVVNTTSQRCAFSISGENQATTRLKITQKLEALRVFYRNTVDCIFSLEARLYNKGEPRVQESMWASEYHTCHAVRFYPLQLFVLYEMGTSHPLMRLTSQRLLYEVMKDRAMDK